MSKFNVGDKVRGINADIKGYEGIIVGDTSFAYQIKITKEGDGHWQDDKWKVGNINTTAYWECCLELIKEPLRNTIIVGITSPEQHKRV